MGYTDAVNTLKWIYKNINYREDDVIIRCNVYPIEYILDDEENDDSDKESNATTVVEMNDGEEEFMF